ncbi:hypothetical protein LXL04_028502 [Taraxacum kok-saghyz]
MSVSSSSSVTHHLVNHYSKYCQRIILETDPLFVQLVYFLSLSLLGFCLLLVTEPRPNYVDKPSNMDLFFMSVSAATTSSMSVVEMEFFSNNQLLILTFLMFVGSDIFVSIVGLQCSISKLRRKRKNENQVDDHLHETEMGVIKEIGDPENWKTEDVYQIASNHLRYNAIRFLGLVVIAYFLVAHLLGFILIPIYLSIFPNINNLLKSKRLSPFTFVVFTTVSSFTNCGFIPVNENMIVFKKNSGLLLILIPQILFGYTLYPPCLRFCIWFAGKFVKKAEAKYLLETPSQEICYFHWLSARHSTFLTLTVFGFLLIQFAMFYSMEWNSEGLSELDNYERIIGVLFVIVNTRYAGETILDLWNIAPAIWVLFVFLM